MDEHYSYLLALSDEANEEVRAQIEKILNRERQQAWLPNGSVTPLPRRPATVKTATEAA